MAKNEVLQFEDFASDIYSSDELDYLERPISYGAFIFVISVAALVGVIVFMRVFFLATIQGDDYAVRAASNVHREERIPARRGVITDRYGIPLAENTETFSITLSAQNALKDRAALDASLLRLSEAIDVPFEDLYTALSEADLAARGDVVLWRNITAEQAIAVRALNEEHIHVSEDLRRLYENGPAFSTVVGYTGASETTRGIEGRFGLEAYYDDVLHGEDGIERYYRDATQQVLSEERAREPLPGSKLVTTIDAEFQQYFYERLSRGMRSLGVHAGVGMAVDPQTGEVLAMVSLPTFDNNVFVDPERRSELVDIFENKHQPLFNRAVSGAYSPASTIKPLVSLASLYEGVVTPEKSIYSKGYIELPNPYFPDKPSRFVDWKPHGWVNARSAIARSSNVYYYAVGGGFEDVPGLGIERLRKYWQFFGFGKETGIDLPAERRGFLPAPEEKEARTGQPWRIGDTYNVSIGQGDLLVSPIQLLMQIASIAADGKFRRPMLVKEIIPYDKETMTYDLSRKVVRSPEVLVDYSSWEMPLEEVQNGMRHTVSQPYGTARLLNDLPLPSAGKTGSAQIFNNRKTNAFYVGYGPYTEPEVAILILIEDAKEGSLNAVPIARDVMRWYYENRSLADE